MTMDTFYSIEPLLTANYYVVGLASFPFSFSFSFSFYHLSTVVVQSLFCFLDEYL